MTLLAAHILSTTSSIRTAFNIMKVLSEVVRMPYRTPALVTAPPLPLLWVSAALCWNVEPAYLARAPA